MVHMHGYRQNILTHISKIKKYIKTYIEICRKLHICNVITQEISINFINVCHPGGRNDTFCQSLKVKKWAQLSTRANASHVQKPNSSQQKDMKNIRAEKKNGLAKKCNCFCFTLCYLGMASVRVRILHENEGNCSVSTTKKGKCVQGINTQSPSPQTNVVQKGPSYQQYHMYPEENTNLRQSQIQLCTWKIFHSTHHILTRFMIGSHSTHDAKRNYSNHTQRSPYSVPVPTTLEHTKFLRTLKAVS